MKAQITIDMPKHCGECLFRIETKIGWIESDYCAVGYDDEYATTPFYELVYKSYFISDRPSWCPLKPIEEG